jgi:hypothetical protein
MPSADTHNEGAMPGAMHQQSFSGNEGLPSPAYPAQQLQATGGDTGQQSRTIIQQRAGSRGWNKCQQNRVSNTAIHSTTGATSRVCFYITAESRCAVSRLDGYAAPMADPGQARASAFQWLENQSVGSTLRQLFGGHGEINSANDNATNRTANSASNSVNNNLNAGNGVATGNAEGHAMAKR